MSYIGQVNGAKRYVAVVIPAYNEEKVISQTFRSLPVSAEDIYVVDDGSTDKTPDLALGFTPNVLSLESNRGKAKAIEALLEEFSLLDRYEFVLFTDADTQLDQKFIVEALTQFDEKTAVVVGQVGNRLTGLVAAFRAFEYMVWQSIYKRAQSILKVIFVAPGCGAIYRSEVLKKLSFDSNTVAEDLDLTLQVHRKKIGEIKYAPKALIYTQDPVTLKGYLNQIFRWYGGFWQNWKKHLIPFGRQRVDLEVGYLALEGLVYPLFFALGLGLSSFYLKILLFTLIGEWLLTGALATVVAFSKRRRDQFGYFIFFPILRWLSSAVFIFTFILVVLLGQSRLRWKMAPRY